MHLLLPCLDCCHHCFVACHQAGHMVRPESSHLMQSFLHTVQGNQHQPCPSGRHGSLDLELPHEARGVALCDQQGCCLGHLQPLSEGILVEVHWSPLIEGQVLECLGWHKVPALPGDKHHPAQGSPWVWQHHVFHKNLCVWGGVGRQGSAGERGGHATVWLHVALCCFVCNPMLPLP